MDAGTLRRPTFWTPNQTLSLFLVARQPVLVESRRGNSPNSECSLRFALHGQRAPILLKLPRTRDQRHAIMWP